MLSSWGQALTVKAAKSYCLGPNEVNFGDLPNPKIASMALLENGIVVKNVRFFVTISEITVTIKFPCTNTLEYVFNY